MRFLDAAIGFCVFLFVVTHVSDVLRLLHWLTTVKLSV